MTGNSGTSVRVDGTGYTLEYAVTESRGEEEPGGIEEYGIRCVLFAEGKSVSEEEIRHISSDYGLMCRLLEKLIKNQVFPVHVKDVIEDVLFVEYEVNGAYAFQ